MLDLWLDCVGEQHDCVLAEKLPQPGLDVGFKAHYLKYPAMRLEPVFCFALIDMKLQDALQQLKGPAESVLQPLRKAIAVIGCWAPSLAWHYFDQLASFDSAQRQSPDELFHIYVPMLLDRPDEWLFQLLWSLCVEIPNAVIFL
jgi:hypothetical protein